MQCSATGIALNATDRLLSPVLIYKDDQVQVIASIVNDIMSLDVDALECLYASKLVAKTFSAKAE